MLWFIMNFIVYGFETIIVILMILMFIEVIFKNRPLWLDDLLKDLFCIDDD